MKKSTREKYGSAKEIVFVVTALGLLILSLFSEKPMFGLIGFFMLGLFLIYDGMRILSLKQFKGYHKFMDPLILKGSGLKFQVYLRFILGLLMVGFVIFSLNS